MPGALEGGMGLRGLRGGWAHHDSVLEANRDGS